MAGLFSLDGNILLWIQEYLRNPVCTEVFRVITHLGDRGQVWILLAGIFLCCKKTRKAGVMIVAALLFSMLITNIGLKHIFARTRPYEVVEGLFPLIPKPEEYSFPSGHTASSFAAAWAVWKNAPKKYGVAALVLAGLIAFSRLYVGVHYPTDVLGGIAAGMMAAYAAEAVVNAAGQGLKLITDRAKSKN